MSELLSMGVLLEALEERVMDSIDAKVKECVKQYVEEEHEKCLNKYSKLVDKTIKNDIDLLTTTGSDSYTRIIAGPPSCWFAGEEIVIRADGSLGVKIEEKVVICSPDGSMNVHFSYGL